jgi:AbrB family looped-hinge helix DNA binding protein
MKTTLSSKGQVVLPVSLRRLMGLEAGETLELEAKEGRIILTPAAKPRAKAVVRTSRVTGLPVLSVSREAAPLTGEQVRELLAEFP